MKRLIPFNLSALAVSIGGIGRPIPKPFGLFLDKPKRPIVFANGERCWQWSRYPIGREPMEQRFRRFARARLPVVCLCLDGGKGGFDVIFGGNGGNLFWLR